MLEKKARLTGRGQVQLPIEIRRKLGAVVGDEILFKMMDEGQVMLEVIKKKKFTDFAGVLPAKKAFPGLEQEESSMRLKVAEKQGQYTAQKREEVKD